MVVFSLTSSKLWNIS